MTSQSSDLSVSSSQKGAVVLLSGGLDSYTTAAIAQQQGFTCYALTVSYGQRHACEILAAEKIAQSLYFAEHKIVELDLRSFGGSALTDNLAVPKSNSIQGISQSIPSTYVPARNTIFLSLALAWAEVLGVFDIFVGVNAVDFSGYPDCRSEFIASFEGLANLATRAAVEGRGHFKINAPILFMGKGEIIEKGTQMGLDYSLTHSCYDPNENGLACGHCESCLIRLQGFGEAHMRDPVKYVSNE